MHSRGTPRMIELKLSRTGRPTAIVHGLTLHSVYDPDREAARFVKRSVTTAPGTFVILGAGLGYIAAEVAESYPAARIVGVYYDREVFEKAWHRPAETWHPGAATALPEYLRRTLGELDLDGFQYTEWQPSARAYPEQSRAAQRDLRRHVDELNASIVTTVSFGQLWLRNSIANFVCGPPPLVSLPIPRDRPVIIAASGPSLSESTPAIREVRTRTTLLALPSALPYLHAAELEPDLAVITDPGFYTGLHTRALSGWRVPLAMPLSACRGLWHTNSPVHYLRQPIPFEEDLLDAASIPATAVPALGTVAATALQLAYQATDAPVVLCGLDLSFDDIRSHVRPNAFEQFLAPRTSRIAPFDHQLFSRAADVSTRNAESRRRTSRALDTYAAWFDAIPDHRLSRTFRLRSAPTHRPLTRVRDMGPDELTAILPGGTLPPQPPAIVFPSPNRARRVLAARELIARYRTLAAGARLSDLADNAPLLALARILAPQPLLAAKRAIRTRTDGAKAERRLLQTITNRLDHVAATLPDLLA